MDTRQDYEAILKLGKQSGGMAQQAIDAFLHLAPEVNLSRHCRMVGKAAMILCKKLNEKGMRLNARLAYGSGLLHDIKKGEPHHDLAARDFLFDLGFARIGSIAGSHMGKGIEKGKMTERELVFLADKLIQKDKVVSLDVRFAKALERTRDDEKQKQAVLDKLALAKDLQTCVETLIDKPIASFLQEECDNDRFH
jgi:hypothetical protein